MSFSLTIELDDQFEFKEQVFNVDMSFDNILTFFEMYDDDELVFGEKLFIGLERLIVEYDNLELDSFEEAYELFKYVLREFLDLNLDEKSSDGESEAKIYDFTKDADLIYASFLSAYNRDLVDLQGKLHWKKFRALFNNLPDESKLKQVIGYRVMKVPSEKEASKEYIKHVRDMKRIYSLDDDKNPDEALNQVASMFKSSKKGGK